MDFNDTPEEAAFRAEARAWLEKNAPREGGSGDEEDGGNLAAAKAWPAARRSSR